MSLENFRYLFLIPGGITTDAFYCISLTKAYFGFESINRSNKNTCRVFSITDQVICSEKSGSTQESIQNFSKDKYSKFYISPFYLNFHNYHK